MNKADECYRTKLGSLKQLRNLLENVDRFNQSSYERRTRRPRQRGQVQTREPIVATHRGELRIDFCA